MPGHVFISYARDGSAGQEWAERIQQELESRGFTCWRDEDSIGAGETLSQRVKQGIDDAAAFICVCSEDALGSHWVDVEVNHAVKQRRSSGMVVVPAIVDAGVEPPFLISNLRWVDFTDTRRDPFEDLICRLQAVEPTAAIPQRADESDYLHNLLHRQGLEQVEKFYVSLSGEKRSKQQLARLAHDDSTRMGSELLLKRFAKQIAEHNEPPKEQFDDILDALRASQRLVVLGEPGTGKTYSLKRIAAELARQALEDSSKPIPLFVPLKEWIDVDKSIDRFVAEHCDKLGTQWNQLLETGRAALLLDGLNELPTRQREQKLAAIEQLCGDQRLQVLIASCRELDYRDIRLGLDELHVKKLSPVRVYDFCRYYCAALQDDASGGERMFWHLAGGEEVEEAWRVWESCDATLAQFWSVENLREEAKAVYDKTTGRQDEVWHEARTNPRSLVRLAKIPYLLTLMADLYLSLGGQGLPSNRSALFGAFVDALIERENQRYREANDGQDHPGAADLPAALANLAWTLQNRAGGPEEVQLALPESALHGLLSGDQRKLAQAANLLEVDDTARFPHQLLQEYFTATGMRARIEAGELPAEKLWPREERWQANGWEESTVLLSGFYEDDPAAFVDWLGRWHPRLMTRCIDTAGFPELDSATLEQLKPDWTARLDPAYEPRPEARHHAGLALGRYEMDSRPGIGLRSDGLPEIDWVEVPAGDFLYGEGDEQSTETLPSYHLSRYPITNAQYQSFIDAGGYDNTLWWEGLAKRIESPDASRWSEPNRLRTDVSWYEAVAFCRWLSDQLGYEVRLPTDHEWEKGARGTDGREYPWGDDYREGHANVCETRDKVGPHYIEETTAVGLYPQGSSPYGLQDMSGNIWEWCLNEYGAPEKVQPGGEAARVVRGGSWLNDPDYARSASRLWYDPVNRNRLIGFRVCCSSPISSDR